MPRESWSLVAFCLLLAVGAGCRPRGTSEVAPGEGAPGTTAVVRVPGLEPGTKADAVVVTVGGQPATVLRVEAGAGIEFLVPERAAGPAEIAVQIGDRPAGRVPFVVRAAPARQLVLSWSGDRITLVSNRGASGLGRASRESGARRDLAYDVVAPDGRLIATGTVPHPIHGRRELFEPEGTMRGAPEPSAATFGLRIPAVPAGSVVRFFEFEPGTDLGTAEGRAARRPVSEVGIGG
jgi:hypothetical protein